MIREAGRLPATLSLDLDNLWAYLRTQGDQSWRSYPSFLPVVIPRIVRFFEQLDLPITIFVVGRDITLGQGEQLIANLAAAGHEIANHSFDHALDFHLGDKARVADEIEQTENLIKSIGADVVVGFRGPSYRLSQTILDVLVERGYQYDASTFPTIAGPLARAYYRASANLTEENKAKTKDLFGSFSDGRRPLAPYAWKVGEAHILELPVSTFPMLRTPIHLTYLNALADYSPMIAHGYLMCALKACKLRGVTPSLLLHGADFLGADDAQCPRFLPGMRRSSEEKMKSLERLLLRFIEQFTVTTLAEFASVLVRNSNAGLNYKSFPD